MDHADPQIEHNVAQHRFEIRSPEGLAMLKYHYDRAGRLSLDHMEVPPARQHHGVAALVAKTAQDFASSQWREVCHQQRKIPIAVPEVRWVPCVPSIPVGGEALNRSCTTFERPFA